PVPLVDRVLCPVRRVFPEHPARVERRVRASAAADLPAEGGLRQSEVFRELVLGSSPARRQADVRVVDELDCFTLVGAVGGFRLKN
ncbi:MAG: hypothetical protein MJ240_10075, partial [Kiritimatiellae bacterium]|nr:hypothetical protein [Kiritimatiellia bacterium]